MSAAIEVGDKAPTLSLPATEPERISIPPENGRGLIVFFYPKDNTTGCTIEAKQFSELKDAFGKKGFDIVGISKDSIKSHKNFIARQELAICLASDPDGQACEAFGVWIEKSMYGRNYMGIDRSTFVIAADGTVNLVWRKVKAKGHAEQVLSKL